MRGRDGMQHFGLRSVAFEYARGFSERSVCDDGSPVLFTPWQHGVLDRALLQVIQHLIAGGVRRSGDRRHLLKVVYVEVADAPGKNLAAADQGIECGNGLRERVAAAPMQ